jgi:hypothetical protein
MCGSPDWLPLHAWETVRPLSPRTAGRPANLFARPCTAAGSPPGFHGVAAATEGATVIRFNRRR